MIRTTDWNAALGELLEARDDQALDAVRVAHRGHRRRPRRAGDPARGGGGHGRFAGARDLAAHAARQPAHRRARTPRSSPGHEESFSRILLAVVDITARKQAEEALRASAENFAFLAVHDSLTGLYNTRYLYEALERLVEEGGPSGIGSRSSSWTSTASSASSTRTAT